MSARPVDGARLEATARAMGAQLAAWREVAWAVSGAVGLPLAVWLFHRSGGVELRDALLLAMSAITLGKVVPQLIAFQAQKKVLLALGWDGARLAREMPPDTRLAEALAGATRTAAAVAKADGIMQRAVMACFGLYLGAPLLAWLIDFLGKDGR